MEIGPFWKQRVSGRKGMGSSRGYSIRKRGLEGEWLRSWAPISRRRRGPGKKLSVLIPGQQRQCVSN